MKMAMIAFFLAALLGVGACGGYSCTGWGCGTGCCTTVCSGWWCTDSCGAYCDTYYETLEIADSEPAHDPEMEVW